MPKQIIPKNKRKRNNFFHINPISALNPRHPPTNFAPVPQSVSLRAALSPSNPVHPKILQIPIQTISPYIPQSDPKYASPPYLSPINFPKKRIISHFFSIFS